MKKILAATAALTYLGVLWSKGRIKFEVRDMNEGGPSFVVEEPTLGGKAQFGLACDHVKVKTGRGIEAVPIPNNRPYTEGEKEEIAAISVELVELSKTESDGVHLNWMVGLADLYRIMRDLGEDTTVHVFTNPSVYEMAVESGDEVLNRVLLEEENVQVVVRFTDEQTCVVVATSQEECDEALSKPRYNDDVSFQIHWAGVGRDMDLYRAPFLNEDGEAILE